MITIQVQTVIKASAVRKDDVRIFGSPQELEFIFPLLRLRGKELLEARGEPYIYVKDLSREKSAALIEMWRDTFHVKIERLPIKDNRSFARGCEVVEPSTLHTLNFQVPVHFMQALERAEDWELMQPGYTLICNDFPIGIKRGHDLLARSWSIVSDRESDRIRESWEKLYWKDLPPKESPYYEYVEDPNGKYIFDEKSKKYVNLDTRRVISPNYIKRYRKEYSPWPQCQRCNQYLTDGPDHWYCRLS